jgi:hypothetical protein
MAARRCPRGSSSRVAGSLVPTPTGGRSSQTRRVARASVLIGGVSSIWPVKLLKSEACSNLGAADHSVLLLDVCVNELSVVLAR